MAALATAESKVSFAAHDVKTTFFITKSENRNQVHYGVRTDRYKLIHFYFDIDAWELYDLKNDPHELNNIYDDPANAELVKELKAELARLQKQYGDSPELAEKFLQEDLKDPKIRERVRKKIEERDERERKAAEAKESKANANP